jgi:CelD/BcsL family acetyltransferase involved in cellulose biosynthesis
MEIRIIDSIQGFENLRGGYIGMFGLGGARTPFYSFRWLRALWEAFGRQDRILIFSLVEEHRIRVALPLRFRETRVRGIRMEKASYLGGTWGLFDIPSDADTPAWERFFLDWLYSKEAPRWSVLQLGPIKTPLTMDFHLLKSLDRSRKPCESKMLRNLYVPLPCSWDEFLAQTSRNFRRTVKAKEEKGRREGFRDEHILSPQCREVEKTVFRVTARSWQGRGGIAVASSPEGKTFYEFLTRSSGEFDLYLTVLNKAGECIAYMLGLLQKGIYYAFDTGYDPEYTAFSPGFLVQLSAMKEAIRLGAREFNLGSDNSYKERFSPLSRQTLDIRIYRTSLLRRLARLSDWANRFFRRNNVRPDSRIWPGKTDGF